MTRPRPSLTPTAALKAASEEEEEVQMKSISIRAAREKLADLVEQAQSEPVWLTRHGKPVAMLLGLEGRVDLGSVIIEGRPEFWEMIERARKSTRPRHTEEEVRKRFGMPPKKKAG